MSNVPEHMKCVDGFYYLVRPECPPQPTYGHGCMAECARLLWRGEGWYGPGCQRVNYRTDRETLYYEPVGTILDDLRTEIVRAAKRLRSIKTFMRGVK